ncbi:myosin regulatory light chain B, smooth adductor muscle-like [Haliotis rubra]|uniref:myosin regulatory light chain B, smooth adductor muscle-like n=1 Tax=Haliotis rubra TaxID=36100 RepID=UPI001EE5B747|nr:myosin regulatory light chain B, smooth adductor muscle-like [Haliotis rubra]
MAPTNVLAMFRPAQVQEFKEAFALIDVNRDGIIQVDDLKSIYANLGKVPSDAELQEMLKEAPGPLNFTTFLNMFGEKMGGTDSEETIKNAFAMFDEDGKGTLPEDYIKDLLQNMGDNFTQDEIKMTWKEAPITKGQFNYVAFTGKLKGKQDEEEMKA